MRAEAGAPRAGGPDLADVASSAKPPGVVVGLTAAHIVINFQCYFPARNKKKKRLGPKTTHNTRPLSDETLSRTV